MTVAAELKDVTKTFDDKTVLENVNLQVQEGEILALLGPNGSGKTTILKILAFIENPSGGETRFQGETVDFKKAEKLRFQSTLVFQRTVLFGTSVFDNVAYGLKVRKTPRNVIGEEVKNALRMVKLEGFEKRPARKLSGGEQQRVAIARALIMKPKLLLADEPTGNLDLKTGEAIFDLLLQLNREEGLSMVVVTHNAKLAKKMSRQMELADGRIQVER